MASASTITFLRLFGITLAALSATPAAAEPSRTGGKLLLTGGVSSVEGAAGGGLASWAVIGGDETEAGIGASAHGTWVALPDFDLTSFGVTLGIHDRVELSYAHQSFDTRAAGAALGLGHGFTFHQQVFGAKLRLIGDAVYGRADKGGMLLHAAELIIPRDGKPAIEAVAPIPERFAAAGFGHE